MLANIRLRTLTRAEYAPRSDQYCEDMDVHMTTSKAILSILAIILASLFVWVVGQPPPRRPNVSVMLLSYTNDSSGPLAIIGVTNLSSDTILIYRPTIEMPAAMKPRGFSYYLASQTNQWARFRLSLKKGLFGTFTVQPPPPTNQSPWRVSFLVHSDFGAAQRIRRAVFGRRMPSEIKTEWINDMDHTSRPYEGSSGKN